MAVGLAQSEGVIAVSLYGSTVHGSLDASSDLDIKVYWRRLSREVVDQLQLEGFELPHDALPSGAHEPLTRCYRGYRGSAFDLELWHVDADAFVREVHDVTRRCDTDDRKQIALSLLLAEEPLFGEEWVVHLQAEAAHYPDGLRSAMIREHLSFPPLALLESHARRPLGAVFCAQLLCRTVENICGVLLGLNRIHGSVLNAKLLNRWLGMMELAPKHFRQRIEGLFGRPAIEAIRDLPCLLDETRTLLAAHCSNEHSLLPSATTTDAAAAPNMNPPAPLRQVALQAARSLADQPGTLSVFLFGSVATGTCDPLSNINLGVILGRGNDVAGRIEPLPGFRLVFSQPHEASGAQVHLHTLGAVRLECWCWPHHEINRILSSAAVEPEPIPEHKLVLAALTSGEVLAGDAVFHPIRCLALRAAEVYYDRDLKRHLYFYPHQALRDRILARGHTVYFWQIMLLAAENILGLLLALNRQTGLPADARALPAWARQAWMAPPDWAPRLSRVFGLPAPLALEDMHALICETLEIVHAVRPAAGADRVLDFHRGVRRSPDTRT